MRLARPIALLITAIAVGFVSYHFIDNKPAKRADIGRAAQTSIEPPAHRNTENHAQVSTGRATFLAAERPSLPALAGDEPAPVLAAFIHEALQEELARKLPGLSLSEDEIRRISETMARIRALSERIGQLEYTPEKGPALRREQAGLVAELGALAELTGMSAVEFSDALSDEGLTTAESDQEDIVHEPLPPAHPR